MKKNEVPYVFTAGIALLGPIINRKRYVMEAHRLPLYQEYGEEAAKKYKSFNRLYDQYGPAYLDENDNAKQLIEDIEALRSHYMAIIDELTAFKEILEQNLQVNGSLVAVTPYPSELFNHNAPGCVDFDLDS